MIGFPSLIRTSVDREVHATAGREAGATNSSGRVGNADGRAERFHKSTFDFNPDGGGLAARPGPKTKENS